MEASSKSFISSFWDSINDLSPLKKQPQLQAQGAVPIHFAATSSSTHTALAPVIDMNKISADSTEKENTTSEAIEVEPRDKQVTSLDSKATRSVTSQVPAKRRRIAEGTLTSKSSALGLLSPLSQPPASQPQRRSSPLTAHEANRRSLGQSSSLPLPTKLARASPHIRRTVAPGASIANPTLPPSSDPYDLDSVILEDDIEKSQEKEVVATQTRNRDNQQGRRSITNPKRRMTSTPRSAKKTAQWVTPRRSEPQYYEIERILDFRRTESASSTEAAHEIELLVHWSGFDQEKDYTWEYEDEVQMTAGESVVEFWKSHPDGGRDIALGIDASSNDGIPYRALRVVGGPKTWRKKGASTGQGTETYQHKNMSETTTRSAVATDGEKTVTEFFRVEWVGYAEKTWEPRENLPEDMVQAYLHVEGQQARRAKKRKRTAN